MNSERKFDFLKAYNVDKADNSIYSEAGWENELPEKLYRYRPLGNGADKDEKELVALQNDNVWAAVADNFADEFTNINILKVTNNDIDKDTLERMVSALIKYRGDIDKAIGAAFENENGEIPKEYIHIVEAAKEFLSSLPQNRESWRKKNIRGIIKKGILDITKECHIMYGDEKAWRKTWLITCFSDENNSAHMWENYANKHKGFCVVYDFKKMIKNGNYVLPVHYTDEILELEHKDKVKIFFLKKPEFSKETEWRMLNVNKENNKNGKLIDIIVPDEIICGSEIDSKIKERLRMICEDKGIKLSKQV